MDQLLNVWLPLLPETFILGLYPGELRISDRSIKLFNGHNLKGRGSLTT